MGSTQGVKITLDSTSYWNGQTMRRTELIPQTSAAINSGKVYYHFSMQRTDINPPSEFREHQIAFFESHFTEMKSGWQSGASGTSDPLLRWDVSSNTQWNTTWEAGIWHNIAYGIDFDAGSVEFYHSTGADDLALAHAAVSVSPSSDGKDWHLGVLELPRDGYVDETEDIYFSGVYVESGDLTTRVSGPGGAVSGSSASASAASSTAPAVSSTDSSATSSVPITSSAASSAVSSTAAIVTSAPSSIDIGTASTFSTAVASTVSSLTASIEPSMASSVPVEAAATPAPSDPEDDDECE